MAQGHISLSEAREPARARSGSARLGAAREPRTSRAEPFLRARFCSEPSRLVPAREPRKNDQFIE
jgi:hypothetical protein